MSRLISNTVHILENDQDAINAAYQVADFALEGRNIRDQTRQLPFEEVSLFSQKGLGGLRIPKKYGGAEVSNKTLAHVFRIINKVKLVFVLLFNKLLLILRYKISKCILFINLDNYFIGNVLFSIAIDQI